MPSHRHRRTAFSAALVAAFAVAAHFLRSDDPAPTPAVLSPSAASRPADLDSTAEAQTPRAGVASQPFQEVVEDPRRTLRVVDPDGVALREGEVFLVDGPGAPVSVRGGGTGRFDVARGTHEVVAACRGYVPDRFALMERCPDATAVCDLVLHKGREVRGVVVDQAGRPLAGALVEAAGREPAEFQGLQDVGLVPQSVAGTGPDAAFVRRARTSEDGRFEIDGLSAGRLHLRASLFGYLPDSIWGWVRVEPEAVDGEQRLLLRRAYVSVVCVEPTCPLGRRHRPERANDFETADAGVY